MPALLFRSRFDLSLLLVAVAWGSTYLAAKELISGGEVIALLAARMLCAAAALAVVLVAMRSRIRTDEWRVGAVLGALLAAVFALETFGIAHTSATNAGVIISLTIVFTPALDAALSRRRLPRGFLLACLVAVAGVALLASGGGFRMPTLGDALILGAAVVRAVHVTTMHRMTADRTLDSLRLTTVQLGTCAVLFSAVSLFHGPSVGGYLATLDVPGLLLFVYLVLVCTVFAFLVQTWAVRGTSPARVSLLLGTEPVWAAVIGIAIAGDAIGPLGLVGIALVLAGTGWGRALDQRASAADGAGGWGAAAPIASPPVAAGSGSPPRMR